MELLAHTIFWPKSNLILLKNFRETITWKIRKIEKIRSTLTLMGIEGQT